jgi:hypothetical protein
MYSSVHPRGSEYLCRDDAYYVLLCARRYAETRQKLALSIADDQRCRELARLNYLLQSGLTEFDRERARRVRRYPEDFRKALVEKDGSLIVRPITSEEAELVRFASSIPPIASIGNLSAVQMAGFADQLDGWAQSDLVDSINVARLLGWADGLRSLIEAVGTDYTPPTIYPVQEKSLFRFLAGE